LKLSTIKLLFW